VKFGRGMLGEWYLDPAFAYLNHGTVGATPRVVLEAQAAIHREIERHPARFLLRELKPMVGAEREAKGRLRAAADAVGAALGARGEDLVFVENATTGVNAVLRSFDLGPGDEVLITDHTYGAVGNAAAYACRRVGARLNTVTLPYPPRAGDELVAAVAAALTPGTRLAVLDHIVSDAAYVMPVAALTSLCRERGVKVLIDGAHAPGMLDLEIAALGADWYVGNLHKWMFAPRSCAVLWAAAEVQDQLHPAVVSWGLDHGFNDEFDWTGTRDPSPYLAAPAAIAFLERLGAGAVRAYNHELVCEAARMLRRRWGSAPGAPETMTGSMTLVQLPGHLEASAEAANRLRDVLHFEHRIEVPIMAWRERLWARISAQVYNEMADFERLAAALAG
jgi:isopenicillin-N epimerase